MIKLVLGYYDKFFPKIVSCMGRGIPQIYGNNI